MPQLRKDPVSNRWVIVNIENPRPADSFPHEHLKRSTKACPFCPGNEAMTPPELLVLGRKHGSKDTSNWLVRVVSNKFPALRIEEKNEGSRSGVYERHGGFGAHEVIIENPDHMREIPDLPVEHIELILEAYRERCIDLRNDTRFKHIIIFKNFGASAGASLEHPHSQLIALPIVPSRILSELKGSSRHHDYTETCLFCAMVQTERKEKRFTVVDESDFIAMTPFASRFPFEMWILPKTHSASFDSLSPDAAKSLARTLKAALGKLKTALVNPSYNWMIHTLPIGAGETGSYHWHFQIIPHLTRVAGFELGTGFYVNPTPPELAAATLRNCNPS